MITSIARFASCNAWLHKFFLVVAQAFVWVIVRIAENAWLRGSVQRVFDPICEELLLCLCLVLLAFTFF